MIYEWHYDDEQSILLRTFLRNQGISKRLLAKIKFHGGEIRLNNKTENVLAKLQKGDHIWVQVPDEGEHETTVPVDIPIAIVYEDDHILIVDKPAGLVVHSGAALEKDSVVARLINLKIPLALGSEANRPGIVHRLDKDTSGLLMVAKTETMLELLKKKLAERDVVREYTSHYRSRMFL